MWYSYYETQKHIWPSIDMNQYEDHEDHDEHNNILK